MSGMRKAISLLAFIAVCAAAQAQRGMDFAEKFMRTCDGDSMVKCITVSPKMMEQIAGMTSSEADDDEGRQDQLRQAMQKLRSARIISVDTLAAEYYDKAVALLEKHSQRFSHWSDYEDGTVQGAFYGRKPKKGNIAKEMVMLQLDNQKGTFTVVDLTGEIDEEFIETLTKAFEPK